jgi:hypothetical protein
VSNSSDPRFFSRLIGMTFLKEIKVVGQLASRKAVAFGNSFMKLNGQLLVEAAGLRCWSEIIGDNQG